MDESTALETSSESNFFLSNLQLLYEQYSETNRLFNSSRAKFWDRFLQIGLPNRKSNFFHYLPLRQFYSKTYQRSSPGVVSSDALLPLILPECSNSLLVFVDGHYSPEHSSISDLPSQMIIQTLTEASKTYSSFLANRWNKMLKEETDCFALLNGAFHGEGIFLYLPPRTRIEKPIQILHFASNSENVLVTPRIHIYAGAQSEAVFLSSTEGRLDSSCWTNLLYDFTLEDGAIIQHHHLTQNTQDSWHFNSIRATLKKNSIFKNVSVTNGGKTVREDYHISLQKPGAEASLYGLSVLNSQNQVHTNVLMHHQAPNCRSLQLFKGVLDGTSRSSFEGKIYVDPEAQKTDAFQLNNHLLLSEHVIANSKPNLEIFADDVKASHGSTIGQIDQELLFYLKTRGLDEASSKKLLIQGFTQEITQLLPIASFAAFPNKFL